MTNYEPVPPTVTVEDVEQLQNMSAFGGGIYVTDQYGIYVDPYSDPAGDYLLCPAHEWETAWGDIDLSSPVAAALDMTEAIASVWSETVVKIDEWFYGTGEDNE